MSAITAVVMFSLAQRAEGKRRAREQRRLNAMNAYVGLHKLMKTLDYIENLARNLDEQFKDAHELGVAGNETGSIVRPIIGAEVFIEDLTAHEIIFLAKTDGELAAKVWEIQQRARNSQTIVREYNRERSEFDGFLQSRSGVVDQLDGQIASVVLQGAEEKEASLRMVKRNHLIIPLVVSLDEDRKSILSLIQDYIAEARKAYGDDFPAKEIAIR